MTVGLFNSLASVKCCSCGTVFGIDDALFAMRKKDHKSFWCPSGHQQHFAGETEADRLKRALAHEQNARVAAQNDAARERRRRYAAQGQVTKIKNRVAKGVCPCCNRYFENVHRHVTSQHPDFLNQQE